MTGPAPPPTKANDTDSRTAVEKACVLLSAFNHQPGSVVGVSELARRSGLTKSTAFRQLTILERADMVERVGRGYRIGRTLRTLAGSAVEYEHSPLTAELLPYLVEIFEHTRHTVQLGVLDGSDIVFLTTVRGHHTLATPTHPRLRLPARTTAAGKVLLAYRGIDAATPDIAAPIASGRSTEIRRQPVAYDIGETNKAVCCVAAPITTGDGPPTAAISICAPNGTPLRGAANVLIRISRVASRRLQTGLAGGNCH